MPRSRCPDDRCRRTYQPAAAGHFGADPTFRYNPAVIAQAFATMGCLYPNRVFLGVGTGEALNEIATGYEGAWPEFKERFARLRESVGLMRQLWSGDRVDFDGDYYRLKGASI